MISDAHEGLKAAIRKCFQGSSWQRCRVHYARNLLANVPKTQVEFVAAAFRSIFALATTKEILARWDEVAATLEDRLPKAAASVHDAKTDVLADQHEEWAIARRYMSDTSMAELAETRDTEPQPHLEG